MKELVVISGKGGTGKTSLTASLAVLAGRAVVADCDVDAADLHLVLTPQVVRQETFQAGKKASIRQEDCIGCGACLAYCRFHAVKKGESEPAGRYFFTMDPISCEGCGVCVTFCPVHAIDFSEQDGGQWFLSQSRCGPMVHARLGIGQGNSGKLVSLVRQQAREWAEKENRDYVIIDGPPGIGCPVIASTTGVDLVLAVTEPTLSALHDLERLVQLVNHFSIPMMVCLNKYDINPVMTEKIEQFCEEKNIGIAGKIPYDPSVSKAQIARQTVVEYDPKAAVASAIAAMWQKLEAALRREN